MLSEERHALTHLRRSQSAADHRRPPGDQPWTVLCMLEGCRSPLADGVARGVTWAAQHGVAESAGCGSLQRRVQVDYVAQQLCSSRAATARAVRGKKGRLRWKIFLTVTSSRDASVVHAALAKPRRATHPHNAGGSSSSASLSCVANFRVVRQLKSILDCPGSRPLDQSFGDE